MTGLAERAPAAPTEAGAGVARAVYGLVDDQYAVVAHTPNLTRDAARELCRAVSVGDPTVPIDDALSFLHVPGWGFVCTRYGTEHDSRGRLALVSDSVLVDAATFRAIRNDPFRCMPRRQELPAGPRELAVPRFSPTAPAAEAIRLADARRAVDETRELRPLLAALLAGERVLCLTPNGPLAPALLQCVVLLLPPLLRTLATFQTVATRAPLHAPRLTAADRRYAELGTVSWTRELPREAAAADPRADAAADALLGLPADALPAAHALYEELAGDDAPAPHLLAEVERVVRYGTLGRALAAGDAAAALRTLSPATGEGRDDRETARLVGLVLDATPPATVADAFVALLAGRSAPSYRAGAALVVELLRRESAGGQDDATARETLDALLRGADRVRWTTDDAPRAVRAALAVAAARRGDGERLVQLADADAPWTAVTGSLPTRSAATPEARVTGTLLSALARAQSRDAEATAGALDALGTLAPALSSASQRDAAALAFALAGRTIAAASAGAPEPLVRVADALVSFWSHVPPADEREAAMRELLAPSSSSGTSDAEPRAAAAARRLASGGLAAEEMAGWLGAAMLRGLASGRGAAPLVAAVKTADAGGPLAAALGRTLGALLVAAAPAGPPLRDGWPALLGTVDPAARRELLVRALGRVTSGAVALDEMAATCAALMEQGFQLDAAAVGVVAPSVARWAATLPATRTGAGHLGMALDLLGRLADVTVARALAAAVLAETPEPLRALVQLRDLARAAAEVDATRDPAAWAARRTMLRARLGADGALLPGEIETLREFLDVHDGAHGGALGRVWPRREGGRR